jgi:DNA-directed RNA polymerase subunit RPC12/RpoP
MAVALDKCAHCDVDIVELTTRVVHGALIYCCANCAEAMEQGGSGSDRHALRHENDLTCAHCGSAIVDESTMQSRGNDAFCCANCARA